MAIGQYNFWIKNAKLELYILSHSALKSVMDICAGGWNNSQSNDETTIATAYTYISHINEQSLLFESLTRCSP